MLGPDAGVDTRAAENDTRDAGVVEPDVGMATPDSGGDTRDAGVVGLDASAETRAAGGDARDTGGDARDAGGAPRDAGVETGDAGGYTLVFSDEFTGSGLDRSKWCTRYVYGGGAALQVRDSACTGPDGYSGTLDFLNDEQQRYVDFNTKGETMHVEDGGTLKLRATKTRADSYAAYESAMIRSKMEFKPTGATSYYVVARLRLPNVKGSWPALWLACGFGSTGKIQWPPEIDIFEGALNGVEDTVKMIRMGSQIKGGHQTDSGAREITYSASSYDRTWDNYVATDTLRGVWLNLGAIWTADQVCYFVNGTKTMCENYRWTDDAGNPANTASLLLNFAVGGAWAGRHGIDDTGFPATLEADYVRVYTFAGKSPPAPLPSP